MSSRRYRQPRVNLEVRVVDGATIMNTPDNIQQLYDYLDQGIEIRGHNGHVVLGKVEGRYIVPKHIMEKLESMNFPKDEFDEYLNRLGYE